MNRLLKNWDFVRLFRLVLGIAITIYSITSKDYVFLMLGGLLLFQAVLNISCCGAGGCSVNEQQEKTVYGDQIKKYDSHEKYKR